MDKKNKPKITPKNGDDFILDTSMTEDEAKAQKIIAGAKKEQYLANKEKSNAELGLLKVEEAKRNLIKTDKVVEIFTSVLSKLKSNLYASSSVLPAQLEGKPHTEIQAILFRYIDSTLEKTVEDLNRNLEGVDIQGIEEVGE